MGDEAIDAVRTIAPAQRPERDVAGAATLPPPPARVHFVGIGGIGMSGLARILRARGYAVGGSDAAASEQTAALLAEGIAVTIGHGPDSGERAAAADLVIATAAVRGENPELAAAAAAGVPIVKRAALLGLLADARLGVAVAGSHGKSTTSGMLVAALRALGEDPTYAIGAVLGATGTNAAPGSGPAMVVEADEYDYSFLQLHPELAIVTNLDYDHPDLFPDQDAYDAAFARFVANIRPAGALVIPVDDAGCARLRVRADFAPPARLVTFGESAEAEWRLARVGDAWAVTGPDCGTVPLPLAVPGVHNGRNATAALATLAALGHAPAAAASALGAYTGVGRRFEAKGEAGGVLVVDDYAHHPKEIRATLRAARERFPGRRLWAVFQPHTFTRLKALLPDFGAAFADADRAMILDVYAARETDHLGVAAADLLALLPVGSLGAADPIAAASRLAGLVAPGDVVLTMGAGDVTATGPRLLALLGGDPVPVGHAPRRGSAEISQTVTADRVDARHPGARTPGPPRVDGPPRGSVPLREGVGPEGPGVRSSPPTIPGRPKLKLLRASPMSLHTTWRVGGPADLLVRAPTPDDLRAAAAWGAAEGLPLTVLGGGSNLLVGDGGIRGLTILARTPGERAEGLVAVEDLGDAVRLRVGAQAPLSWTARYAAERGWAGLDWGVGLPGTIGGATVNNAGAHGTEQKDHLEAVVVLDNDGVVEEKPASWLEAAYRHTVIKAAPRPRPFHVLEVVVRLPKGDPAALVRLADEHAAFRKRTQPTGACAGSTFANPPGDHAGRLLEEAGLKGHRVGPAGFSPKHANWIVNDGRATAAQVRELIAVARDRVRERFGVELRQEIEELGEG